MAPPPRGSSFDNAFALIDGTLADETAHALLHRKPGRKDAPGWVRETEAETVVPPCGVICKAIGVKSPSSADYIHMSTGNAYTLADSLDRVQRASAEILAAMLSVE